MDKYLVSDFLLNIVIHNTLFICGRMAGWGTRDPKGSRILLFGWFSCGSDIVGRHGPLHEAGHAMSLRGRWAY